jgi:3-methyladenine DNA glycosylase AlkC
VTGFSLKDHLFNQAKVEYLAGLFSIKNKRFPANSFVNNVMKKLPTLELKQRITWIAESLQEFLPEHYPDAANDIIECLPPPLDETKTDDDFGDFIFAPLGEFVVRNGMTEEHVGLSLTTLKELTKRFSMEDSLRYFIRQHPQKTLKELRRWVADKNYHVRRLVSESTRPLLPWSGRIDWSTDVTLPLLNRLHADQTRYVTRSVANHLNDIAKSQPDLVVQTLRQWHEQRLQDADELLWMTKHALRTLIKQGHADSLSLLGYSVTPKIRCGQVQLAQRCLKMGDVLEFSIDIQAERNEALVVDYAIDFIKAGGKRSVKVYKATKLKLAKGEMYTVTKKHKLLAQATTYQLYPGTHHLTVQINGQPFGSVTFELSNA